MNTTESTIAPAEATETVPAVPPANPLMVLRSNWDASRQHKDDITERYQAKQAELRDAIEQLTQHWRQSNAELIEEYETINGQFLALDADLRRAVIARWRELSASDPNLRAVDKALGLSVAVKEEAAVTADEAAAVAWAEKNLPLAVKKTVNRDLFDKVILELNPTERPESVTVTTRQKVTAVIKK